MCLATITAVDKSLEKGKIDRRPGKLFFHSEQERLSWIATVESYRLLEREAAIRTASQAHSLTWVEALERLLTE